MQAVSGFLAGLVGLLATAVMLALLAATARRVMGAPVGWVRAGLVSLVSLTVASSALTYGMRRAGWATSDGRLAVDPLVALAGIALTFAWTFVLGLCVLLVLELLVPTGALPTPWRALRGLRQGRRESRRYAQVVTIAVRHGLVGAVRRTARRHDPTGLVPGDAERLARGLTDALGEAGVTFVKFGQLLSTRRDLLPPVFVDALATLQSDVPPAPWPDVERELVAALGRPVDDAFARLDPEPLAAASVGQVHAATLVDGRRVVVKVRRPGAREQVDLDLAILARVARRLERDTVWGRSLGVVALADGFAASLREELDYTAEAENTLALRAALRVVPDGEGASSGPLVTVPDVVPELSGPALLVLEHLEGTPVGRAQDVLGALDEAARAGLARRLLRATLEQVLVAGTFHADLHPGNVLVTPDGGLALLDMGAVGRLGEPERLGLGALLLAVDGDDAVAATDALLELLDAPPGLDARRLERAVGQVVLRFRAGAAVDASFGTLFRLVTDAGCAVPPQVAAAFRTFTALDGTLRLLSPGFDLVAGARDEAEPLVRRLVTPDALRRKVTQQLVGLAPELQRLPRRASRLVSDLEAGRLAVNVRVLADPQDRAFLTGLVRQVVSTVVACAAVVAAVVLLVADGGPRLGDDVALYPVLGAALGFAGTVLGVRVLVFAFRGDAGR
ncbi:ABC1 kinase family protein [Cellulosimicrobium marinum]|uniref:ABC1 kinase family protein n=1 Tax=Cellulosimicrobium marinum TaxID=1638992 RepID=UPI001E55B106|nr:AarF/UbiB family protein [Cellulosimicrobium marinum]MCB7135294.1 AarF/ABC1/UbiB kinase family protein [Cellulosimicrobium marinum]